MSMASLFDQASCTCCFIIPVCCMTLNLMLLLLAEQALDRTRCVHSRFSASIQTMQVQHGECLLRRSSHGSSPVLGLQSAPPLPAKLLEQAFTPRSAQAVEQALGHIAQQLVQTKKAQGHEVSPGLAALQQGKTSFPAWHSCRFAGRLRAVVALHCSWSSAKLPSLE